MALAITTKHHILAQANNLGLIGGYATIATLGQQMPPSISRSILHHSMTISHHAMPTLMCELATWLHNLPQLHGGYK